MTPRVKASFRTQCRALFYKNAAFQWNNRRTNIRLVLTPIGFCVLLAILQAVVNNALDSDANKCGCKCLYCCDNRSGRDICRQATDADPCVPGQFSSCEEQDKTQCGLSYSTTDQASHCAIQAPASWPVFMQVPRVPYRLQPYRPDAAILYTGQNRTTADGIANSFFASPDTSNAAAVSQAQVDLGSATGNGQGLRVGEAFAGLGFTFATPSPAPYSYYIEGAFINATAIFNVVPNCSSDSSTAALNSLLSSNSQKNTFFQLPFNCTMPVPVWRTSSDAIQDTLYCGFKQARDCNNQNFLSIQGVGQAYDFGESSASNWNLKIWYNDSAILRAGQQPPPMARVNKGINLATNAFLRWTLGDQYTATMNGIMEMPKPGSKTTLDFSSLLGPLFFAWLLELLLPVMVDQLVTEKSRRLRIMMKMHGLQDKAYWSVQYLWFLLIYVAYMCILIAFGSVINLKFFRLNDYGFTFVFFFIWGNTLVASAFLTSVFFTNPRTALVTCYLYVFASGLLGSLLIGVYMGVDAWWVNIVQIIPAFALYRGLYIMSQYAFKGAYNGGPGFRFSEFNKEGNGLGAAVGILLGEWLLFLALAWYLEQVLPSGTGVRRHPLFFLPFKWQPKGRKRSQQATPARRFSLDKNPKLAFQEDPSTEGELEDVLAERSRVEEMSSYTGQAVVVKNLCKVYPAQDGNAAKMAVKSLTMAVEEGECFGLLGPNGAGKSSAIHMLVGLQEPTSGTAYIEGLNIKEDMEEIYSRMGVCPQHDLLWDFLNPQEHLLFYGRLKSIPEDELKTEIETSLRKVNLWAGGVNTKRVGQFSGGMKRRLSVAISLMGAPAVVYMDEPSTGLDPASRRNLWDVVKSAKAGRGIILTTHSMEEAEVLCDRLAIFVDGQIVCIGNPKALTSRHGGYLVFTITIASGEDPSLADRLVTSFSPSARKTYSLGGTQRYELPTQEVSLARIFAAMEQAKSRMTILDWGVSNSTLEEVFIKFARKLGVESRA